MVCPYTFNSASALRKHYWEIQGRIISVPDSPAPQRGKRQAHPLVTSPDWPVGAQPSVTSLQDWWAIIRAYWQAYVNNQFNCGQDQDCIFDELTGLSDEEHTASLRDSPHMGEYFTMQLLEQMRSNSFMFANAVMSIIRTVHSPLPAELPLANFPC